MTVMQFNVRQYESYTRKWYLNVMWISEFITSQVKLILISDNGFCDSLFQYIMLPLFTDRLYSVSGVIGL